MPDPDNCTAALLDRCAHGDQDAYDALFGLIYADLRRRARMLSEGHAATLSTTALVHEAYLSLAGAHLALNDKAHFFRIAARAMRRILIDASRRRNADKRGAGLESVTLDPALAVQERDLDLVALDQALDQLTAIEPRMAQVVELHFYAGLEFVAIAQMLELSERTVARDWRVARALLQQSLADDAVARP
ncbi:MAG: sigma-70 family RNA polymerase sigma factor [Dokdonella sp.]|uniref:ECF-type sigma factor n=1 Tax=Dokdonella sp. TaxID=2291710 RepID=UPI0025C330DA|nr:ECF-type sigma factor [Dokdonella sp.]MBZ0223135.1 sigma-70 family RNA polymerase sigma factor [Dokdonella sp.]MCC7256187.1 sigma-70 family RNA polymerase sigma factor [Dokdonella sp.]